MLKSKNSNKGFTLIEMIIAMSIFSVVIFIGYKVINGSNEASANQAKVFEQQQAANLVNKYLTKDIEQSIEPISSYKIINATGDYEYIIKTENNDVKYLVEKNKDTNEYNLVRQVNNGEKIELLNNQIIASDIPFTINPSKSNNNLYEVELKYNTEEDIKTYAFDVYPRISKEEIIKPPVNPDKGDDFEGTNGFIQFGYKEKNDTTNQIWTDAGPKGQGGPIHNIKPDPIDKPKEDKLFKIDVNIDTFNSSGEVEAKLNDTIIAKAKGHEFKGKPNQIKITKYGDINIVNSKIIVTYKQGEKESLKEINVLNETKVYSIPTEYEGKSQYSIKITGHIEIPNENNDYGEVLIQFGIKKQ